MENPEIKIRSKDGKQQKPTHYVGGPFIEGPGSLTCPLNVLLKTSIQFDCQLKKQIGQVSVPAITSLFFKF